MDCTKKIITWPYGEGVNAQIWVLRIGELGQFVQSEKKKNIDFGYVKREKKNQRLNLCSTALENMCGFFIDYLFINSSFFPPSSLWFLFVPFHSSDPPPFAFCSPR